MKSQREVTDLGLGPGGSGSDGAVGVLRKHLGCVLVFVVGRPFDPRSRTRVEPATRIQGRLSVTPRLTQLVEADPG